MPIPRRSLTLAVAALLAACASYEPQPVDLAAHDASYRARMPDLDAVRAFARSLGARVDGEALTRQEARTLALWFHPELRRARAQVDVAAQLAENSGYWPDPTIQGSVADKLGNTNPWLVTSAVGLTVPLSRQFSLQRQLADAKHGTARLLTLVREVEVRDALDATWTRWSAAQHRADALTELCATLKALDQIGARLLAAHQLSRPQARIFALEHASRCAELDAALADATIARAEIDQMLGLPPGSAVPLRQELTIESRAPQQDAVAAALREGPRLLPAWRAHVEAERRVEHELSKQWPMLTLFPGWEEEDATNRPAIGFTLPLPLWNRNRLLVAEAEGQRLAAKTALESALEESTQSRVRASAARLAAMSRRTRLESELAPACREQLADATRLAELGELDPLLLLDAVTRLYEAQRDALTAAVDEAAATAAENSLFWPEGCNPRDAGTTPTQEPK